MTSSIEALAVVGDVEIFARGVERGWPSGAGIGAQISLYRRVADVYYIYLALPLVGDIEIFAADREPVGLATGDADRACKSGRGRIADVDDAHRGGGKVGYKRVFAGERDAERARHAVGADQCRRNRIADIDDIETGRGVADVGVLARHGDCFCAAERIGADDGWIFGRADVDDAQTYGVFRGIRVAAGNGGGVGVAGGCNCRGERRRT